MIVGASSPACLRDGRRVVHDHITTPGEHHAAAHELPMPLAGLLFWPLHRFGRFSGLDHAFSVEKPGGGIALQPFGSLRP